jgi:hypothetical protein
MVTPKNKKTKDITSFVSFLYCSFPFLYLCGNIEHDNAVNVC